MNINDYVPSIMNPRCVIRDDLCSQNSVVSRRSLSLKQNNAFPKRNSLVKVHLSGKENPPIVNHYSHDVGVVGHFQQHPHQISKNDKVNQDTSYKDLYTKLPINHEEQSSPFSNGDLSFSTIQDILANNVDVVDLYTKLPINQEEQSSPFSNGDLSFSTIQDILANNVERSFSNEFNQEISKPQEEDILQEFITLSSATALDNIDTIRSNYITNEQVPVVSVSFGIKNCDAVDVTSTANIKRLRVNNKHNSTNIDCEVLENSCLSTESEVSRDENMNETSSKPLKRSAVAVNLQIKKRKPSPADRTKNSKVLILKTNAIEKISHVIVQPPNYKFVKRYPCFRSSNKSVSDENGANLKQISLETFFRKTHVEVGGENVEEMSRHANLLGPVRCERVLHSAKGFRSNDPPKSAEVKKAIFSPRSRLKTSNSESPSPRARNESAIATDAKTCESVVSSAPLPTPVKTRSVKSTTSPGNVPHHKIVAGTHFAVDAFSYGDIPNVKHYFLTHFHSDHHSGLKKSFNKLLFCSKITADLCISRLGVNAKCIHVISADEALRIDGVEVTPLDANHCPGALMLVFTLPNGKSLLHTGDFRACPPMESYPVFWNRDIHTIYLDTTYCNPRYDFPTQDRSLEMALYILRQKKMALEKAGRKFASVLIVCGTYTIGKEKFFLGMSRRVGCSVWACPEKERVLHVVEGAQCTRDSPRACQLHVVPMRDLTHEKLSSYLESLQGAFSEVVAFKPSGWENGKHAPVVKDAVTIHGIPYSEHSSFSELVRFVKFLKPKQVVPTVDISGGVKAVQKYFPCPLVYKDGVQCQSRLTDYYSIQARAHSPAVT